jgi:hypothetical protein
MKAHHIAALVCFAIAGLLYALASSEMAAGAIGFFGFMIEFVGWGTLATGAK